MRRIGIGLLAACLLASVAAVGVAGAVGSADSVTTDHDTGPTATAQSDEEVWLPERKVDVVHGNTTQFDVTVPESADGPVTVEIGGESHEYRLVATLRDANDDGIIALEYSAGVEGPETSSLTAVDGDEVTVTDKTALKREGMTARSYEFRLANGTSPDGETLDTGAFGVVFDATHIDTSDDPRDDESTTENRSDGDRDRSETGDDWFSTRTPTADVDEIAHVDVTLQPDANGSVTLNIGDGAGYSLVATLRDENDDGVIRTDFDVSAAGTDQNPLSVDGIDEVTLHRQTDLPDGGLAPGNYETNLTLGRPPAGEEVAIGTLVVNSRDNDPDGTEATAKPGETGGEWNWSDRRDSVIPNGGIVPVRQEAVAHVPVQVRPGTAVTLRIRRPGTPDDYVVAVEDTDGSGRVPLLFRTGAVDAGSHRVATSGDNDVRLLEGASDTDAIAEGLLSIDVYNGSGLRYDDDGIRNEHLGVGTLQLLEANGTDTDPTETQTTGPSIGDDDDGENLNGLAAIGVGGLLAVVGVAILFGVRRQ
ncbi:hypothetical protein BV210_10195 [Halorientalis sp. IM1011]|uniref:hypothetical protein n=1 Tax=Halorientalis sp. IM1011 TaxID=1932360 RepID=UPI00097CD708|nr:hypothetical protein [Halorientalis sp. IM1011]AQL43060.1 hypothetical protein BV210_10195 [Halorientalis sp. IM1011]